jgi:hypothetical protein
LTVSSSSPVVLLRLFQLRGEFLSGPNSVWGRRAISLSGQSLAEHWIWFVGLYGRPRYLDLIFLSLLWSYGVCCPVYTNLGGFRIIHVFSFISSLDDILRFQKISKKNPRCLL